MTPSDEAPDFAEALTAWRAWRVVRRDGQLFLCSVVQRTIWPARQTLRAKCLRRPSLLRRLRRQDEHGAPAQSCECGIYATSIEGVVNYLTGTPITGAGRVFGMVSLWETVIECERGYRAACAYPAHIYVPADAGGDYDEGCHRIAAGLKRYGVPVQRVSGPSREAVFAIASERAA